jgi:hypothetical protein
MLIDHLRQGHRDANLRDIPEGQTTLQGFLEQVYDPPAGHEQRAIRLLDAPHQIPLNLWGDEGDVAQV